MTVVVFHVDFDIVESSLFVQQLNFETKTQTENDQRDVNEKPICDFERRPESGFTFLFYATTIKWYLKKKNELHIVDELACIKTQAFVLFLVL